MAKSAALSVERAWNTVALEERIELISKSQAQGFTAAAAFSILIGCIAYGFDQIQLLTVALGGALIISPIFSGQRWRREKSALILRYLAARSVARRYAYGCGIPDLDISLIYRGFIQELYSNSEHELVRRMESGEDAPPAAVREVWICLMAGGIVVMSERTGGAKLEFSAVFNPDFKMETPKGDYPRHAVILHGNGLSRDRKALLWSNSVGAQYVFERRVTTLVEESILERQKLIEQIASKRG